MTAPGPADAFRLLLLADVPPGSPLPLEPVTAALRGGVTAVQLRAKSAPSGTLEHHAQELLGLCREAGVPLLINDRPDVALAVNAAGAHVGPSDLPPEAARRVLGPRILGVSARDPERVAAAARAGADYLGVGALRTTGSKPEAPALGLDGIEAIARSTGIPVVAVGGVRPDDLPALKRAGAAGVAVLSGILNAPDPEAAARRYRDAWDRG